MGFKWDVPPGQSLEQLGNNYARAVFTSGRKIAHKRAADMEEYAKANAPWQDRTGDARRGLNATVEETGPIGTIVLAHGVSYGLWLEIANGGQYSILPQTIDLFAPLVMRDLQRMLNLGIVSLE